VLACPVSSTIGQVDLLVRQIDLAGVPNRHSRWWAVPERTEGLQVPKQLPVGALEQGHELLSEPLEALLDDESLDLVAALLPQFGCGTVLAEECMLNV
jgi:hypothetical protein